MDWYNVKKILNEKIVLAIVNVIGLTEDFNFDHFKNLMNSLNFEICQHDKLNPEEYYTIYDEFNNHIMSLNITKGIIYYGKCVTFKNGGAGFSNSKRIQTKTKY